MSSTPSWPRCYKTFSMLNSAEHEILNAHKYQEIQHFSGSDKPRMLFFLLKKIIAGKNLCSMKLSMEKKL